MAGSGTFTGDLAARLGLHDVDADAPAATRTSLPDSKVREPSLIALPDEPYPFSAQVGPEMFPATASR